jgi:Ni,Fe-hydrogenase I cytochrome b subunit
MHILLIRGMCFKLEYHGQLYIKFKTNCYISQGSRWYFLIEKNPEGKNNQVYLFCYFNSLTLTALFVIINSLAQHSCGG